jgi:elongator complex protein 4
MSSFRRATPRAPAVAATAAASASSSSLPSPAGSSVVAAKVALPGTKPFLNGQALISTGLAQLDAIIGGGWLLGTLVLLDIPRHDDAAASTSLVDDFHRYFVAEGIVSGQHAVVVSDDADSFATHQLPLELSMAQKQVKAQLAASANPSADDESLTIAWQYQKYISDATSSSSLDKPRFCHSFDLSRPMHTELLRVNAPSTLDLSTYSGSMDVAYAQLIADIARTVETYSSDARVVRVSVRELGSPLLGPPSSAHMTALFQFVRKLRHLASSTRNRSVVFQLSGHLYAFPTAFANELRHLSDYVLQVKSFVGESDMLPGELVEFQGLLEIKRLARIHALACHTLDAAKFGIKRERRKMKIEKFHLPPEGSRSSSERDRKTAVATAAGGSKSNLVSSSFTRTSSSSVGCRSGTSSAGGFNPLDF